MSNNTLPTLPDGYEFVQELGRGAQGSVWLVRNNNTGGRYEACKIVTSISPKELSRFKREIQILATLNHPNIITMYYANPKEKFFLMEYVAGGNLYHYCRKKVLNLKQRIELFLGITEGLAFAHKKGLVHRDLKPENIVMSEDGIAKITDFGISRLSDSSSQTMNITSGTPSYMAPELWSQNPPDKRSDLWSLGIILYEMLTGKCPFKGTVQEICYMVTQGNLKAPHVVSSLPPLGQKLSAICMKALKQDPGKRYHHCEEMIADIKRCLEQGDDIVESPTSIGLSTDLAFKDDDADEVQLHESSADAALEDDLDLEPAETQPAVQAKAPAPVVAKKPVSTSGLDFEENDALPPAGDPLEILPEEGGVAAAPQNLFEKHKYPIVGAAAILVMIIGLILMMPKSLAALQEDLLSQDIEKQQDAFSELKLRGEDAVEVLVYGLNSPQVKMRKDIITHISKYPQSASFYLVEVVEDYANAFTHQARIYAVRALGDLNVDSEITLQGLLAKSSTPEDLRQEAIQSLVKLKPDTYKKKYHFMGGLWLSTRDLRKQGYIETENGWILVSKLFSDLEDKVSQTSVGRKNLEKIRESILSDLQQDKNVQLKDFLSEWDKFFGQYGDIAAEFSKLSNSIEGNLSVETKYKNDITKSLVDLHTDNMEFVDNLISLKQQGIAIQVMQKELENVSEIVTWDKIDFPSEKAQELKQRHHEIVKDSTLYVYTKFNFFGDYDTTDFRDQVMSGIEKSIIRANVYPKFSSRTPQQDRPKHWIVCEYREANIGSYFGNRDKKRKHIRRLRALCNVSYWVESNKVKNWEDVISSNIYLELSKKQTGDLQEAICNMVRNDLKEKFVTWEPKKFDQRKINRDGENTQKVRGSTVYSQKALDIIYTKSKRKMKGLIKKESSRYIHFVVVKIAKGKTSFVEVKIAKSKIAKVKRISDEIRQQRLQDLENIGKQNIVDRKKIDLVPLEKVAWEFGKGTGLVYTSKHFVLYCNTPEEFTREIAFRTESIFEAYKQFFPITRNSDQKIKIYIFNSTAEYQRYIGKAFSNPAYYSPTHNHIVASCDLSSYKSEITKIKQHHDKIRASIAKNEQSIARYRNQITQQKRRLHDDLDKRLARGQIKQRDYDNAYRNIRSQITNINKQVNSILRDQKKLKSEVRRYDYQNSKLIPKYVDSMVEMMYHEAFHAFLKNFLFTEEQTMYVPRWLNEGLAQYFESSFFSNDRLIIGEMDKDRLRFLKKFTKRNNAVAIKDLLVAGYKDFMVMSSDNLENSNLHYIQSWAVVYYIATLFDLRKGDVFGPYVRNIWSGKDQVKAFEELVGMPVEKFEKKWLEFFQK
ncbi:serine/threonine protein kinase [Candidatus Uabimicrobium amorphum]|uniref:Putative serine/threonine-protein kinase n=1 Tax=Uabimicrobium amorphum TaxID=2596890 RepID=A0A5S9IU42_UABAM|nr:serine/threonine-protein kinase [Candidatus Uabimicrobium amorphum]BBM88139.1 putative serine/threonine-protein kinase [Candidatus Uabimicrobium amorphum]